MIKLRAKNFFPTRILAVILGLSTFISTAMAKSAEASSWQVNLPASSLTFNTTKSSVAGVGGVTETMRFKSFKGGMDAQGRVLLDIDLSSVESGIEIRDQRLQTIFWNVATHPVVTFASQIKAADLQKINAAKESVQLTVEGLLIMAGQTKPIQAQLQVTPLNNKLIINTRQAIVVNASDFGLSTGVEALKAIMGLNYLSSSAPVSFEIELVMPASARTKAASAMLAPSKGQ